ncbi:acyl-CoA dehydrogenase [Rhodococcus aetherivorans]|uniref:Acyl-CoA dehydrogenase n=1 Tax=Rhodococcus aetherivorans TaxID=191292 RepID=A0ABQ0YHP4_9NOCA|nr:acyl-CoA dehydrogenase family protein [Rhodococcus aetherivorans]ETT25295.1 acyl-CoA dehydrogenase domain-containing protein [Rhodococcus rhodochrous ATCC 21198]NGP29664.1 acyl-CoA dehydrogenase [Rhodococcus aetherivorans]GES35999.1 acyl-CoA dehydrogenase [Rhodococcus aetherivorans]
MTMIPDVEPDLSDLMHAVFAKHAGKHAAGGPTADKIRELDTALWAELSELGLTRLTGSPETGGSGASWLEAAELLSAAAAAGVRTPVAEHDLLAGALLEEAGLPADEKLRTVAILDPSGMASSVPWASAAESILAVWHAGDQRFIADVPASSFNIMAGTNLVGEPRDRVQIDLDNMSGTPITDDAVERYLLKGALTRAIMVSSALDHALALSCEHVTARTQFGRPLARFQAVQHLIADAAAECALARAATEAALAAAIRSDDWSGGDLLFRIAVARSCVGHAATTVVRNAHQVHGAIGTTNEHSLHRYTRAALAWRAEFGSVTYWDRRLAAIAGAAGPENLWPLIAD